MSVGIMGNEVNSQESESLDEIDYLHARPEEDAILSEAEANVCSHYTTFIIIFTCFVVSLKMGTFMIFLCVKK